MNYIPEHLLRFPKGAAIDSLAKRFNMPNTPDMQDWQYEVADSTRIDEFLSVYKSGELTEDEQFVLMETLLESFEELHSSLEDDDRWLELLKYIEENINIHIYTVWYWSCLESDLEDAFHITPYFRPILDRHRYRFI